jgi:hypothetical protein
LEAGTLAERGQGLDVQTLIGLHHHLHDLANQLCDLKSQGREVIAQTLWNDLQRSGDALLAQLQSMLPPRED